MNKRLTIIGRELGQLYHRRNYLTAETTDTEIILAARELELSPADGWPGKNAEERKLSQERAFVADEVITRGREYLTTLKGSELGTLADIEALEAERRAIEWMIRAQLAEALAGRRENRGDVADTGFDDAADNAAVEI
jgi:hypothetical protein